MEPVGRLGRIDIVAYELLILFVHPVVGIEQSSVPPIHRVAVVRVGAGLGHIRDLGTGKLTVLSTVWIRDDRRFTDFVLAQSEVRGTGVVDVEVRVHVVLAVDREQVRSGRQSVNRKVAVSSGSIDDSTRSRVRDVGDITTGARQLRHFFCGESRVLLGSVLISGAVPDTSTVSVPLATVSSTSPSKSGRPEPATVALTSAKPPVLTET